MGKIVDFPRNSMNSREFDRGFNSIINCCQMHELDHVNGCKVCKAIEMLKERRNETTKSGYTHGQRVGCSFIVRTEPHKCQELNGLFELKRRELA